jgi:uncharacterized membrane protein YkgB
LPPFSVVCTVAPLTVSLSAGVTELIVGMAFVAGLSTAAVGSGGIFVIISFISCLRFRI